MEKKFYKVSLHKPSLLFAALFSGLAIYLLLSPCPEEKLKAVIVVFSCLLISTVFVILSFVLSYIKEDKNGFWTNY